MRVRVTLLLLAAGAGAGPDKVLQRETWKSIRSGIRWLESQQDKDTGLFLSTKGKAHSVATTALVLDSLMECGATRVAHEFFPVARQILHRGMHGLAKVQTESGRFVPGTGPPTYPDALACMILVRDCPRRPDPRLKKYVVRGQEALKRAQRSDGSWSVRAEAVGDPVLTSLCARACWEDPGKVVRYLKSVLDREPLEVPAPVDPGPAALVVPTSNAGRAAAALDGLYRLDPAVALHLDTRLARTWLGVHPLGENRDDPVHAYWVVRHVACREGAVARKWQDTLRDALLRLQSPKGHWQFRGRSDTVSTALALWCLGHPLWFQYRVGRYGLFSRTPMPPK